MTRTKATTKPEKELILSKVVESWREVTNLSATLCRDSEVLAGELFDIMYNVMKGLLNE